MSKIKFKVFNLMIKIWIINSEIYAKLTGLKPIVNDAHRLNFNKLIKITNEA